MTSLEGADRSAVYNGEHHSMVKSSSIVANRERPEVLSPALKSKVERYVVFWRNSLAELARKGRRERRHQAGLLDGAHDGPTHHRLRRRCDLIVPLFTRLSRLSVAKYRQ